jgi:hypothetical protein
MSSAELTPWARVDGLAREEVGELLWEHRRLVKTWAMRGTLHLLPADELGLWLGGFATYDHYLKPAWFKAFDISREELFELIELVGKALSGAPLTREELAEEVGRLGRAEHLRASTWPAGSVSRARRAPAGCSTRWATR